MTKDEHLKSLSGRKKTVEGADGSDAWFHFDILYEGETSEKPRNAFLDLLRGKKKRQRG